MIMQEQPRNLGLQTLSACPRRPALLEHSRHRPAMQMRPRAIWITLNAGPHVKASPHFSPPRNDKVLEKVGFARPPSPNSRGTALASGVLSRTGN